MYIYTYTLIGYTLIGCLPGAQGHAHGDAADELGLQASLAPALI